MNKSIDILLVNPVFLNANQAERELMSPYFPLGLLYLAAFLRQHGTGVEIFDGTFAEGVGDFYQALSRYNPRMVGITALQPSRDIALSLAEMAKEHAALVIMGGPDPTSAPAAYLESSAVDIVVHHEGELTLIQLIELINRHGNPLPDLIDFPGIAYRDLDGWIVLNPRRPFILNLDELPFPARDLIDVDQYLLTWKEINGYASLTISLGRGCPHGCDWCQDAVHGQDFRQRSPQNVAAEVINLLETYNIDRLRVVNDVDGIDRKWIETWADYAEKEAAVIPFEALNDLERKNLPMLEVRDTL